MSHRNKLRRRLAELPSLSPSKAGDEGEKMMKIITSTQAAVALGVSERRIRQLVAELSLTPQRVGRLLIFTPADLRKMKARRTTRGVVKKVKI